MRQGEIGGAPKVARVGESGRGSPLTWTRQALLLAEKIAATEPLKHEFPAGKTPLVPRAVLPVIACS
jgi:hypothetical protein